MVAAAILVALSCLVIFVLTVMLTLTSPFSPKTKHNWPMLGALPGLVANFNDLLTWFTLIANQPGMTTYMLKGPWFSEHDLLITVDPSNLQYMSSTRYANFPRGAKSNEMLDIFGEGYFNLDGNEYAAHRKIHRSIMCHKEFNKFMNGLVFEKVENGMTTILDHVAGGGTLGNGSGGVVDLQDLFSRYTHDLTHRLVLGNDANTLSLRWSQVPFTQAMNDVMQSVWMRHFLPRSIWRLQRIIGVGHEKVHRKAKDLLQKFATRIVSAKHDEFNSQCSKIVQNEKFNDMITAYFMGDEYYRSGEGDEVLKGSLLSLMLGGSDSSAAALVWFFWNLSQHPSVHAKIRDEISELVLEEENRGKPHVFTEEEVSKLIYLHAVICETLRLHPPFPFQPRAPYEQDILPSGHKVIPNSTMIVIPLYVMARVEAIWGKDCADFKPERWITDDRGFKQEPSYKFFIFSSGQRNCIGREVAFTMIKTAIATIVHNYDVEVLSNQKVVPVYSSVLRAKYGLHARIKKRFS